MYTLRHQKGFTLIELIIVIAIIGILSTVIVAALNSSREHSRNAARVTQIQEYTKALSLSYSDVGAYPTYGPVVTGTTICLGDYSDNACWSSNSVSEQSVISDALVPNFFSSLPPVENATFGDDTYEGMTYQHINSGRGYTLQYFMEGTGEDCLLPYTTSSDVGSDTLCVYTPD